VIDCYLHLKNAALLLIEVDNFINETLLSAIDVDDDNDKEDGCEDDD